MTSPVWVSEGSASERAMPKSESFTCPSAVTSMFEGFTSRCTMPVLVRGRQRVGRLTEHLGRPVRGQRPLGAQVAREVGAVDVLHHQVLLVAVLDEVVDGHDVGVAQTGGQPRLALGALGPLAGVGVLAGHRAQTLDRHGAPEHLVAAEPDGAHSAAPDLPLEACTCPRSRLLAPP